MKYFNWPFLQEPIYRWFIFVVIMMLFLVVWGDVVRYMKASI